MARQRERVTVIELHKSGMKTAEIVRTTNYKQRTVYNIVNRYKETGELSDRPRTGRPRTATAAANVNKVRQRVRRNPVRSMRKMAKEIGIDERSVRRIVKRKLNLRSYKISRVHFLNDTMKEKRLKNCRRMLRLIGGVRLAKVVFTDEKLFTVEPQHNHQNDRQLLTPGQQKTPDAKTAAHSHFPTSVMVWGGICATGKTPLVFIERNVKINAAYYQQAVLRDVLQPWAAQHFGPEGFTLQQDWAPAHSAKTTIELCNELFPGFWGKDVWPSNSPDLNPLDYSVWSIMQQKLSGTRYTTLEQLKVALKRAWDEITVEQCASIVANFRKRLRACITAEGGHFEHFL